MSSTLWRELNFTKDRPHPLPLLHRDARILLHVAHLKERRDGRDPRRRRPGLRRGGVLAVPAGGDGDETVLVQAVPRRRRTVLCVPRRALHQGES